MTQPPRRAHARRAPRRAGRRPGSAAPLALVAPGAIAALAAPLPAPWIAPVARADQYHASNFLLGARAQGMGGAYAALADDASGVTYNPGGTAFARGADVSLSAASFYQRKTVYGRVYGGRDFHENARGALSTSLAGLTRLGGTAPLTGVAFGFALSTPDAGLVDENERVESEPGAGLLAYHRTQVSRSTTLHAAGSFAVGIGKTLGLGMGAGYFDVDELTLIYQDVLQGPYSFPGTGTTPVRSLATINSRASVRVGGLEVAVGTRWQPWDALGFGVAYRSRKVVRQRTSVERDRVDAWIGPDDRPVRSASGTDPRVSGKVTRTQSRTDSDSAFRAWPSEVRAGFALKPHKAATWTFDVAHHTAASAEPRPLARAAVTNLHTGAELVWFSLVATRLGAFTNFDATTTRDPLSAEGRGEHIDFLGASGGLAVRFKKSEYGANYVHQWGRGRAEKAPDVASPVSSRFQVLTFTASQAL